ncbi:MAG: hypothetical protein AAFO04_03055 [Cyanobacteria bacterium J06592_8]
MAEAILQVLFGDIKSVDQAWLEQFTSETVIQQYIDILDGKESRKVIRV